MILVEMEQKKSYIIGIGGMRAVGKSTVARNLSVLLRGDVISCGYLREIARHDDSSNNQELFKSVARCSHLEESKKNLLVQSETLLPLIEASIGRYRDRKATLIVEGAHLLPDLCKEKFDLLVIFVAPQEKTERRMYKDKDRKVSPEMLARNSELQEYLISEAKKNEIPIIDTTSIPEASIQLIKLLSPTKPLLIKEQV